MKMAIKLTTGILAAAITAGGAWAQTPDAIDQARSAAKSLQQKQATGASAEAKSSAKPTPGAPAPAVKPIVIPSARAKSSPAEPVSKAVSASAENKLQRVNVVPSGDGVQIEISSTQGVKPRVSKLGSPARVVVELPETVIASAQTKIPVGSGGVKGVRIGMDGKTPPTTSVVVDLEKALPYDITPGAAGKLVLTLHGDGAAPEVAKAAAAPAKKEAKPVVQPKAVAKATPAPKSAVVKPQAPKVAAKIEAPKPGAPAAKQAAKAGAVAVAAPPAPAEKPAPKPEDKKWAMTGKRDPFFSPVVQQQGSGCATGKKCLEIGAINLRGVVKSDTGFIAVVTNNLNKAYFLRENDPVFNGYVVKITGDSVTFQETLQDKLGKPFTREVVKKIFTPAV
jgi:hypothetical protein